ncbi:alpha-L-glutamate ligase-related protein [Halopseudomonas formosensis]|uniref:Alpha-L-glutamate ligase-related protein n=1 Tax=Halopseudomonas formosensis TaxID=1002526 RepID=A0A1I6AHJ0_9GAMM|nr:alpha-L-glutamate ligase-related protein [Halopseudomonas formosensis]
MLFWKTWKALSEAGVMGINRRNADYVLKYNKRHLYPVVDDKILTKERAIAAQINVPDLYGIIDTEKDIGKFTQLVENHKDFVIKPAQGAGGDGILVIGDRYEGRYRTVSGKIISLEEIEHHISNILSGLYSLGGHRDRVLIEYRVKPDPIFKSISYEGVPDIRIIVLLGYPVMAMLRLPTRQSNGKANLHQGAIGVGVDLTTGITLKGTWLNNKISKHPDTANEVAGVQLPDWDGFMRLATSCYELSGLGYIGVDLVLDERKGPLILELNARPGLNIQIANDAGLTHRCHAVERHVAELKKAGRTETVEERMAFSQQHFGKPVFLSADEAPVEEPPVEPDTPAPDA